MKVARRTQQGAIEQSTLFTTFSLAAGHYGGVFYGGYRWNLCPRLERERNHGSDCAQETSIGRNVHRCFAFGCAGFACSPGGCADRFAANPGVSSECEGSLLSLQHLQPD